MSKPHITVATGYLIVMDAGGTLHVYCDDCTFRPVFPRNENVLGYNALHGYRKPRPYWFDGSECVTADCLPSYTVDAYFQKELPQSLPECSGR